MQRGVHNLWCSGAESVLVKREQVADKNNLVVEAYAAVMVRINTDVRLSKLKGQGLQDSYALYIQ